eukprot:GFYU01003650.1.p1 GENE.GFYU01003650.1~~GFYU01003650.1.p1  ORF type:complete len:512 (-),score=162.41 GFYU01003650.1:49-1584(-)
MTSPYSSRYTSRFRTEEDEKEELLKEKKAEERRKLDAAKKKEQDTSLGSVRRHFLMASANKKDMRSMQEWTSFIRLLTDNGLIREKDATLLNENIKPSDERPFTLDDFQMFVLKNVSKSPELSEAVKMIESVLSASFSQLNSFLLQCNLWDIHRLDEKQTTQLLSLVEQLSDLNQNNLKEAKKWSESLEKNVGQEDIRTLFWDRVNKKTTESLQVKYNSHEFQRNCAGAIEKKCRDIRVKQIYYKDNVIRVMEELEHSARKTIAFDYDRGTEVEVLNVPRSGVPFQMLTEVYNELDAARQLELSPQYMSYLGCDDHSDPENMMFFTELIKGMSLSKILTTLGPVNEHSSMALLWRHDILSGFKDILDQSTFTINKPITTSNIYVGEFGRRIYIKDVKWGLDRQECGKPLKEINKDTEKQLLQYFSNILLEMNSQEAEDKALHEVSPICNAVVRVCKMERHAKFEELLAHPYFTWSSAKIEDVKVDFEKYVGANHAKLDDGPSIQVGRSTGR